MFKKITLQRKQYFYISNNLFLVLLTLVVLAVSSARGKDLRCPLNLEPYDLAPYPYDTTKYYECLPSGLLKISTCPTGQTFSLINAKCTEFDHGYGDREYGVPAVAATDSPNKLDCASGGVEGIPDKLELTGSV